MANFSDLPTEIQLLIAQDLSSELFKLKSLNSVFLNYWMDTRWEFVRVELRYPDSAIRLLQRVVDPFVVMRPKTLSIVVHQSEHPSSSKHPKKTFDCAVTILLDSLPLLTNITSLTIQVFESLTFDITAFFQRITSMSFARKLQRLSLLGLVGMLMSLWECSVHNTPFESLTNLNLYLKDNPIMQTKFSLSFKHFLCSLAPTLQFLYISTTIDLSPVFNALAQPLSFSQSHSSVPFPNLLDLHLNISLQCDPRSLSQFLLIHNNLQHLHLHTHKVFDPETEKRLGALLTELANHNDQLPSLRTLDIYPSVTQAGLSALLTLIKGSAPTLSSLVIPIRYLTDEEAKRVVDAFTDDEVPITTTPEKPSKLKSLHMNISYLSVPFLDLLACKLPQLETLSLCISDVIDSDQDPFYDQLSYRRYHPNITCSQDVLHAWKLQNLKIYCDLGNAGHIKRVMAGAVPALARKMKWGDMDL